MSPELERVLARFHALPTLDRLQLRARALTCPFDAVVAEVPAGRVLELGCGHGLLSALLAERSDRDVKGIDHDERRIALAKTAAARPNLTFATSSIQDEPAASLDAVVICDVLYLVPRDDWAPLLQACVSRLKPGGALVLKEASNTPAWKHARTYAQEFVMKNVLRRTRGETVTFTSPEEMAGLMRECGLSTRVRDLSKGYGTPHYLVVGGK